MGNCSRIKSKPSKTCVGSMDSYIYFYKKVKSATNTTAIDPNLYLKPTASMWARKDSVNGEEIFDGVNMIGKITNKFYIRYDSIVLNKNYIIKHNDNFYEIIDIDPDLHGQRETIVIKCSIRGDSSLINTRI